MITFTLPMRPRSKLRPRLGKGGRVVTPRATRAFEAELALRAGVALGGRTLLGPLELHLEFVFRRTPTAPPGKARCPRTCIPDIDNLTKAVMDGLSSSRVWEDDRQVTRLTAAKWWGAAGEESAVTVSLGEHRGEEQL